MVQKIVVTTYKCEVCGRSYDDEETACSCESYPAPRLRPGDMILRRGHSDDLQGHLHTATIDFIREVHQDFRTTIGHPITYVTEGGGRISGEPSNARPGYLNVQSRLWHPGHHEERLETSLKEICGVSGKTWPGSVMSPADRQTSGDTFTIQECLEVIKRALPQFQQERMGYLLPTLYALVYSLTWASSSSQTTKGCYVTEDQRRILEFLSGELTPEKARFFLGGQEYRNVNTSPSTRLIRMFSDNRWGMVWGAMTNYQMGESLTLAGTSTDDELCQAVQAYRQAVLAGTAPYSSQTALQILFPLNTNKAAGKLPPHVMEWVKNNGITGTSMTRLKRMYELATSPSSSATRSVPMKPNLELWPGKRVIAVVSHKGGVGKSTVASMLAHALKTSGKRVLFFDGDLAGPSAPTLFPVADPHYRVEQRMIVPHRINGIDVASLGYLLAPGEALQWQGPYYQTLFHIFAHFMDSAAADVVVIDMPPGTSDILQAVKSFCPHAEYLVVTTGSEMSLVDTRRLVQLLQAHSRPVLGVIDNMAYMCDASGQKLPLWGTAGNAVETFAQELGISFLGRLPMNQVGKPTAQEIFQSECLPRIVDPVGN